MTASNKNVPGPTLQKRQKPKPSKIPSDLIPRFGRHQTVYALPCDRRVVKAIGSSGLDMGEKPVVVSHTFGLRPAPPV